jgi:hypothetical protein
MWKRRLALILGIVGAVGTALAPLVNKRARDSTHLAASIVVDAAISCVFWGAVGLGIGALIDASKRRSGRALTTAYQAPAPVPMAGVADWLPDPSRRFWYRFWDGERWTADVSSSGRAYTDEPTL